MKLPTEESLDSTASQPKRGWIEAHEWALRILLHSAIFLMLAPAYGSFCLPLFDYPIWHDRFELIALSKGLSAWAQVNAGFGSAGRFAPLYFLIQGLTLRLNHLPQLDYWILAMTSFQISSYLLYNLIRYTSKSSGLAFAGCLFFVLNPYTVSTYWTVLNPEPMQMPLVLAFLIFSYKFLTETNPKVHCLCALLFYALALFSKESTVFLLPAVILQALFAFLLNVTPKRTSIWLIFGSLVVTALWWVARLVFVGPSGAGVPAGTLVTFLPLAVCKRLVIVAIENFGIRSRLVYCGGFCLPAEFPVGFCRTFQTGSGSGYTALFLLLPSATWLVGLSFISQIPIRYLVPLIALGAAIAVQPLHSMEGGLRKYFG